VTEASAARTGLFEKIEHARLVLPLILLVACGAMMFVQAQGDFPLNDDENHAIGTWNFARTGHFKFTISTTPPLRAQVVWGAVWTWLFGESFDVLRASTMVLAALTLIVIYSLLKSGGASPGLRVFGTLAFLFNPIFFWSAHTYMTEVPFVFASSVAMLAFYRGIRKERLAWMLLGCTAVAVSWWIRQGVINAFPPILVLLIFRNRVTTRWRTFLVPPVLTVVAFVVLWFVKRDWMVAQQAEFFYHWKMWKEPSFRLPEIISLIVSYILYNIHNAMILFLPLSVGMLFQLPAIRAAWQRVVVVWCIVAFTLAATYLVSHGAAWPYYPVVHCCELTGANIIANLSLGPPTMSDVWGGPNLYPFHVSFATRVVATYATAIIAAIAFTVMIIMAATRSNLLIWLCLAHLAIGTATLPVSGQLLDRYALDSAWTVGPVLALLIPWTDRRARLACTVTLVVVALFSMLSVQEYLAWNRARWAAYWQLRNGGAAIRDIDGGAEPLLYYEVAIAKDQHERRRLAFGPGKRRYVVAFSPMPGFRVIARHPWSAWLGTRRSEVVTLERE